MRADDSVWQQAPAAALRLWREAGSVGWTLNGPAIDWSLSQPLREADWQVAVERLLQSGGPAAQGRFDIGAAAVPYRAVGYAPGWLLWLLPDAERGAGRGGGWRDAAEKLALMQGFGRMGFFERDVRGERDWWDRHMFRLVGLEPALRPPRFEDVLRFIHPDDRERLRSHHLAAMQRAGRYEIRYRVLRTDGRQRDVHALTEVRNDEHGMPMTMLGVLIDDTEGADRVRAQQAVSEQLQRALELARISVWRIDLQRERVHFNDFGYRITGVEPSAEGLDLDTLRAMVHPQDLPSVQQAAQRAAASEEVIDVEARYRNPDGSYRHLLTRRVAERDADGQVVALAGVSLDQTADFAERQRAQALAQRIQLVAEAAGIGVWTIRNPGQGDAERVEWNAQMFRIYGLPEDGPAPPVAEWMGQRVLEADRQGVAEARRRARRSGNNRFETEFRVVRPDGTLRWVMCRSQRESVDGSERIQGIHIDVTAQRRLDDELRVQQHRLKLATQIGGVGVWDRDMHTGTIIWDEQMYRLRGLQPDDPRSPREIDQQIVAPQALQERWQLIERHLADSEPYDYEFEVRWPDGSTRWLVSTGHAVRDAGGKALRMVGLNWDVTQRRRVEAALREAEAAERASRAKSEFLARMSHELRTPLNAILGFAQLLEQDGQRPLDAVQGERLTRIRSAGAHLLSLIDEVLDLSAVEAGALTVTLQPVSLDDTLAEVTQWVAPLAAASGVVLHVPRSGAWLQADLRRLRQIVANLLTNAIKYNRPGGDVQVVARRMLIDGVPGWEFGVRDSGRGLNADQLAHLYEPFNRLGAERDGIEGRGIGLMTVHHLVRLMGGRLQVDSRVGDGSEFKVWLPAALAPEEPDPAEPEPLVAAAPPPPAAVLQDVLYVEDNEVNVLVVRELLALRPALRLHVAATGREGLEAALRLRPALVLIDMQLPDMGGAELLRRLRAEALPSRLVALSANAMPEVVAGARAAGFDDYWTKPIDVAQFLSGLDRLVSSAIDTPETRT